MEKQPMSPGYWECRRSNRSPLLLDVSFPAAPARVINIHEYDHVSKTFNQDFSTNRSNDLKEAIISKSTILQSGFNSTF